MVVLPFDNSRKTTGFGRARRLIPQGGPSRLNAHTRMRLNSMHSRKNRLPNLDKRFYAAVDDVLEKSLPSAELPRKTKSVNKPAFSLINLRDVERSTGLNLIEKKPQYIQVRSDNDKKFSYTDIKVMVYRVVADHGRDLPFYRNYLKHRELNESVQKEIQELEKELSFDEKKAARSLMDIALNGLGNHLTLEDLTRVELRSGLPANSFTFRALDLEDLGQNPGIRFYSRAELYKALLEATLVNDRPAPYVYYHTNSHKKSGNASFDSMSHKGHRLDHYQAESRSACERGRYIWTKKIFDICKAIGVNTKDLSWDLFMAMVDKVNEISVRSLKHNDRVSRRVRHVLTKDELHELCRSLNISQRHLLKQETVEQMQGRINVGGCSGPPIP